jgi:hypothetical protein
MSWKAMWTGSGSGRFAGGKSESPLTSAPGSWNASRLNPLGISIAYRVVSFSRSGIPPMRRGAPRSVRNCPSSAASLAG